MSQTAAPPADPDRFRPHAVRELGGMFDDVSGRYDLLNRIMSLGQDRAWRVAMWRAVPEDARAVLDLCTGSGVSLTGLRRPGRLVVGIDVSFGMLAVAAGRQNPLGWAPRLVCADGFRLPIADGALDAVTIAFGIRNLRPIEDALRELRRVLRPGGALVVLEAAAPARGWFAPVHTFYLRHLVPLAGRLSPDPSAYQYLSRSIFEFGSGPEFERALAAAGFEVVGRRSFMVGATRLWAAERPVEPGQKIPPPGSQRLQIARPGGANGVKVPSHADLREGERRLWEWVQLGLAGALAGTFTYAFWILVNYRADLPLWGWRRLLGWIGVGGGALFFAVRAIQLAVRTLRPGLRP